MWFIFNWVQTISTFPFKIFASDWKKDDFQAPHKISGDADLVACAPSITTVRKKLNLGFISSLLPVG